DRLYSIVSGSDCVQYVQRNKLEISMVTGDWDYKLVGSFRTDATFTPGQVNIAAPGHPAAGGATGSFDGFTGSHTFALAGRFLPDGATILATVNRTVPPSIVRLSDVDDMIDGTKQHEETVGTLDTL